MLTDYTDTLIRYWRYINHLLTYLLSYIVSLSL